MLDVLLVSTSLRLLLLDEFLLEASALEIVIFLHVLAFVNQSESGG